MNSEKIIEIKKALQDHSIEKLKYQDGIKIKEIDFIDILTLINELESENERLRLERDVLIGKKIVEKQKHDKAIIMKIDIQKQLKNRIAELEKENGELKEHVTEVEKGIINIAKERNKKDELASKFIDSYNDSLKQFAEKLKAKYGKSCSEYYPMLIEMTSDDIDELLKECEK